MSGEHEPLPYQETTSDEYAIHAKETFEIVKTKDGSLALVGSCKRCGHAMEFLIAKDGVTRTWLARLTGARNRVLDPALALPALADDEDGAQMICACEQEHPGRPDGYLGCGAYWDVAVTMS